MAASIGVLDWRLHSRTELVNKPRRGERWSLRNDNCGLAGRRSGPCGPRKKKSRLFSKTLSSPEVLFPDVFCHRSLWIPLRWGTENIRRYVDLTGYLQLKSSLCSKKSPTAILSIFLHKPMARPHCRTGFPRGVVPRRFLGFSLY